MEEQKRRFAILKESLFERFGGERNAYRLPLFHFTHCKATFHFHARGLFSSCSFFNFRACCRRQRGFFVLFSFETVAPSADRQSAFMSRFRDPLAELETHFKQQAFPFLLPFLLKHSPKKESGDTCGIGRNARLRHGEA